MRRLDRRALVSRKTFAGKMRGERLTGRRGEPVEFADSGLRWRRPLPADLPPAAIVQADSRPGTI